MKAAFLFFLLIAGSIAGHAQKTGIPTSQYPWHVQELNEATGNFYSLSLF